MRYPRIGLLFIAALAGLMTECVGYVDGPRYTRGYSSPPPVYVQQEVVVQDDYVYYPGYQIYYPPLLTGRGRTLWLGAEESQFSEDRKPDENFPLSWGRGRTSSSTGRYGQATLAKTSS